MILELVTPENFREDDYLKANPDAHSDVHAGKFQTVREHYDNNVNTVRYQYASSSSSALSSRITVASSGGGGSLLGKLEGNIISLENTNEVFRNIFAEPDFLESDKLGLTSQFQEHAGEYHAKYYNPQLFIHYLTHALELTGIDYIEPDIFDFGSGSGNSVFAALEVFEKCNIMASDLSVELLQILNTIREEYYPNANVPCIAMDIQKTKLKNDSFDIFLGLAILHHVIEPDIVFNIAYKALKNNGSLIMFEPMLGYQILGAVYKTILTMDKYMRQSEALPENIKASLTALSFDYEIRAKMYDKILHVKITDLDDKWIYSKIHINEMAKRAGFKEVKFKDLNQHPRYVNELRAVLPLLGSDIREVPEWAIEVISNFDAMDIKSRYNEVNFATAIVCVK